MEELLWNIIANTARGRGRGQHLEPEPNQNSTFKDFMDTKPPIFTTAEEPLQADEWLNSIEQKFHLLRVSEQMKTEFAAN
jgi:hypothetical protein